MRDLQEYAQNRLAELVSYAVIGFMEVSDVVSVIEGMEGEFDGDSYCPYYNQQVDVINEYEREFGNDAEEFCGHTQYRASDWQQAQTDYAYAIAYAAFEHYFSEAKQELIEGLEEFESDVASELEFDDTIKVQLSSSCAHGWAAHDRELSDGTMVFESGQLDGRNGMERNVNGTWISCCVDRPTDTE
jgi:hypothetical protein